MRCVPLLNVFPCWKAAERAESLDADRECKLRAAIADEAAVAIPFSFVSVNAAAFSRSSDMVTRLWAVLYISCIAAPAT